jgi:hypothetical protein
MVSESSIDLCLIIHSSPVADAEQVMMKSNTGSTSSILYFETEHLT